MSVLLWIVAVVWFALFSVVWLRVTSTTRHTLTGLVQQDLSCGYSWLSSLLFCLPVLRRRLYESLSKSH
ncbi:hypothetical protein megetsur_32 [Escherichia phage megetsur]|nr:hypothetical protein megetsur_32 [Escherichia phage megetsur]